MGMTVRRLAIIFYDSPIVFQRCQRLQPRPNRRITIGVTLAGQLARSDSGSAVLCDLSPHRVTELAVNGLCDVAGGSTLQGTVAGDCATSSPLGMVPLDLVLTVRNGCDEG